MTDKIQKTDDQWRSELTPEQYRIARQGGTERAFTGEHHDTKTDGTYTCVCCGLALFSSDHKYDSGSGWPSFHSPVEDRHVDKKSDQAHGMTRVEVVCSGCDAHLGHVFEDGPNPTGQRYCVNSASLKLEPKDES